MNSYRKARKDAQLTQAELSARIHVTQGSISQWETGATSPDVKTLILLADVYGISLDRLVGRDEHEKSPSTMPEDELDRQLLNLIHQLTPEKKKLLIEFLQQK